MTVRGTAFQLVRDGALAAAVPSLAWAYLSWRHKLGIGVIYVWPWVLMTTLLCAYRADKLGLNSSPLGKVAYDLRDPRGQLAFSSRHCAPVELCH